MVAVVVLRWARLVLWSRWRSARVHGNWERMVANQDDDVVECVNNLFGMEESSASLRRTGRSGLGTP